MTTLILIKLLFKNKYIRVNKRNKYLFLVLLAMLVSLNATPQVTADFTTISSSSGCGPLFVEFKDLSLGNPTSWFWNFGNGIVSNEQNPSILFTSPGSYDVYLEVSYSSFSDVKISTSFINVYDSPEASIKVLSDSLGCIPFSTEFKGVSSSSSMINSWLWNFGDGGSALIQNSEYTYLNSGLFSVSLLVTDTNGCQDLITKNDIIKVHSSPELNFSADVTFSCDSTQLVVFSNNSNYADSYNWDFGDGEFSSLNNPTHLYNSGEFSVKLYAHNANCYDSLVLLDLINVVGFTEPKIIVNNTEGCEELSVNFSSDTFNDSYTYLWNFGDGVTSVLQNPNHYYDSIGEYNVSLTSSYDSVCTTTQTFDSLISVFPNPEILFFSDTLLCYFPYQAQFVDYTFGATHWLWDFGNGVVSETQNPSNIYNATGVYDVSLTVADTNGCLSTKTINDYIKVNESPLSEFSLEENQFCAGEEISFINLSSESSTDWLWIFGDDSISNIKNPIKVYNKSGIYDVKLISSAGMCSDTFEINNCVEILSPIAFFEDIHNCDDPLKVIFKDLSEKSSSIFWDFGDGLTSSVNEPTHLFQNLGLHNVTMIANNDSTGCTHTYSKEINLTNPIANFDYLINPNNGYEDSVGCAPRRVYVDNQSIDCSYYWIDWGNGNISSGESNIYSDAGLYDVKLIISDDYYCTDTFTIKRMYNMHKFEADFKISNKIGCDSLLVSFKSSSNIPIESYIWDFGDGEISNDMDPNHIYYNEGVYDVSLYLNPIYGKCQDSLIKFEYINFKKPIADFSSNINEICSGDQVQFNNLSYGVGYSSFWSVDDSIFSNLTNPNFQFMSNGIYDINLSITDSSGCYDNVTKTSFINVSTPSASFSVNPLNSNCPPLIADFVNTSSSDANIYKWNFGDGSTSYVDNPSHLYSSTGLFDTYLIVENSFGCRDTMYKNNYIDMLGIFPSGNFTVSDTLVCVNESILLTPNVSNTVSYIWDFGNGIFSYDSLANISYDNSGIFIPTLILENSSGCRLVLNSEDSIIVNETIVDAGADISICEGEIVQLNAQGTGNHFTWTSENEIVSLNTFNPLVSPTFSSYYYVLNSNELCIANDSVYINVFNDVPDITFSVDNVCEDEITTFEANSGLSSTNNFFSWSFGQFGKIVSSELFLGDNNITLIVENQDNNCTDTLVQNIEIFQKPVADFLFSDICFGDSVTFIDNSSGNIISWDYDFGDDFGISNNQNSIYKYLSSGDFNVILNVVSEMGCQNNINKNVTVNELPLVEFSISNNCENLGNTFIDLSKTLDGNIQFIEFDFNDGITTNDSIYTHIFDGYGLFDVTLTATSDRGCTDYKTKTARVYANPNVNYEVSQFCFGEPTIFNNNSLNNSSDIISLLWDFGLEYTFNDNDVSYIFPKPGLFDVSLLITNDNGCYKKLTKQIEIFKLPSANFNVISDVCIGEEVLISYIPDENLSKVNSWKYNFSDGDYSLSKDPIYIYDTIGNFDIGLEVFTSDGCRNDTTMFEVIETHNYPISDFSPDKLYASELDSEINFYNYSIEANLFTWDFGNGNISNDVNPSVAFDEPMTYEVVLISSNEFEFNFSQFL